jgi:RNA polymerase sigma-70 factor (ECF subfamily)
VRAAAAHLDPLFCVWEVLPVSVPERDAARELDALVRAHQAALLAFALKLCRQPQDAHDLVQDTFERALRAWSGSVPPPANERAWLCMVLHNLFIDRCRRAARAPRSANIDELQVPAREPDAPPAWSALTVDQVRAALEQVDPELRECYRLHELEGLSYAEIAARLGAPVSTVGTRIMRARRRLRALLQATSAGPAAKSA